MKKLKKKRVLRKILRNTNCPRLSIFRSNKHIYAQLIDDSQGHTLASSSTLTSNTLNGKKSKASKHASFIVGQNIAKKAKEKNLLKVVFDRNDYLYHGRVKSLAEGARKEGLIF